MINDIKEQFKIITIEKNISIDTTQVDESHCIAADAELVSTILRNLVDNAIKFSQPNSTVHVMTEKLESQLKIKVSDSGRGMTPEQQAMIFDLYENKSTKGTSGESGSGLGLSLVNDLVRETNGELTIKSESGKGTEITVGFNI